MAYQTCALKDFRENNYSINQIPFMKVLDFIPPLGKNGPWMAGGSVRKFMSGIENDADYDIFFANELQVVEYRNLLLNCGASLTSSNIFNFTYDLQGYKIQCIHQSFHNTLIQTMNRFDISICQYGFDGTNLVWSDEASEDVRDGKLRFLDISDPVYNFNRAFRYAATGGFEPRDGEVKRVLRKVIGAPDSVKHPRGSPSSVPATVSLDVK